MSTFMMRTQKNCHNLGLYNKFCPAPLYIPPPRCPINDHGCSPTFETTYLLYLSHLNTKGTPPPPIFLPRFSKMFWNFEAFHVPNDHPKSPKMTILDQKCTSYQFKYLKRCL